MKKWLGWVVLAVLALGPAGCATICKTMRQDNLEKVSAAVHTIQGGYEALLAKLEKNPTSEVRMAVAAADVVLATFGNLSKNFCENEAAAANAAIVAQQVQEAVK